MIDFFVYLEAASTMNIDWSAKKVQEFTDLICNSNSNFQMQWEFGDEIWCTISGEGKESIYIHSLVPLVVATSGIVDYLEQMNQIHPVVLLLDNSMKTEKYRMSKAKMEEFYDQNLSDNVTYDSLSFMDIWWLRV